MKVRIFKTARKRFLITNSGRILGVKYTEVNGYYFVGGFSVHSLVCKAYHGLPKKGLEVRHLDGNRKNNHPDNLCWGTRRENMLDAIKHGTHISCKNKGEDNPNATLNEWIVIEIHRLKEDTDLTCRQIGSLFGVTRDTVQRIVSGGRWPHIYKRMNYCAK